ncbi:MAG: transposase [Clostridia bacterium]|nr:transposase [Clostridia bacterium]
MARHNRIKSSTNIYHVIWRGVGQQNIFIEDYDYKKFLWILSDCKKSFDMKIYAYCLMTNHIHLLIRVENISEAMGRLGGNYAQWFNTKYGRVGHLFQDRFLSEPVEDDRYLLTAIRYIHQNPVKAYMAEKVDDYKWSSFKHYIYNSDLVDKDLIMGMMSKKQFIEFNSEVNEDKCLDISERIVRVTDEEAAKIILKNLNSTNLFDLNKLPDNLKCKVIKKCLKSGVSKNQIIKLTKIKRYTLEKAITA